MKTALPSARPRSPPPAALAAALLAAARGLLRALLQPGVELAGLEDVRRLAHRRVAEAAQLGADDGVVADPRGRDAELRVDAAHRVDLHAEGRDPEVVDDVLGLDGEVDLLPQRHVELRRGDLLRRRRRPVRSRRSR